MLCRCGLLNNGWRVVPKCWDPTPSISAMALAPSLPILLYPRLTLVTQVLFCQKLNEKTRLAGALNWLETHGKQCASQLLSGVKTHQEYVCGGGGSLVGGVYEDGESNKNQR